MLGSPRKALTWFTLWPIITLPVIVFSVAFSVPSWSHPYPELSLTIDQRPHQKTLFLNRELMLSPDDDQGRTLISRGTERRQPQGREMERWESLPPDKQQELRRRMERYKELSPENQELFRRRYEQWQQLAPEERKRMKENLDGWQGLSPQEQEQIRQKFRTP